MIPAAAGVCIIATIALASLATVLAAVALVHYLTSKHGASSGKETPPDRTKMEPKETLAAPESAADQPTDAEFSAEEPTDQPTDPEFAAEQPTDPEFAAEQPTDPEFATEEPTDTEFSTDQPTDTEFAADQPTDTDQPTDAPPSPEEEEERPSSGSDLEESDGENSPSQTADDYGPPLEDKPDRREESGLDVPNDPSESESRETQEKALEFAPVVRETEAFHLHELETKSNGRVTAGGIYAFFQIHGKEIKIFDAHPPRDMADGEILRAWNEIRAFDLALTPNLTTLIVWSCVELENLTNLECCSKLTRLYIGKNPRLDLTNIRSAIFKLHNLKSLTILSQSAAVDGPLFTDAETKRIFRNNENLKEIVCDDYHRIYRPDERRLGL